MSSTELRVTLRITVTLKIFYNMVVQKQIILIMKWLKDTILKSFLEAIDNLLD